MKRKQRIENKKIWKSIGKNLKNHNKVRINKKLLVEIELLLH